MSVDAANEQTTHKDNVVCRFNRDEHDRQLLRVALESRIDLNGSSHPCGKVFDEHIKWSNSPTKTSMWTEHWRLDVDSSSCLRHHTQTAILMDVSAVLWTVV